ncbi:IgA-specific serine endopeptidase autotransporter precursor, partial [Haemophilus influenzae]
GRSKTSSCRVGCETKSRS